MCKCVNLAGEEQKLIPIFFAEWKMDVAGDGTLEEGEEAAAVMEASVQQEVATFCVVVTRIIWKNI